MMDDKVRHEIDFHVEFTMTESARWQGSTQRRFEELRDLIQEHFKGSRVRLVSTSSHYFKTQKTLREDLQHLVSAARHVEMARITAPHDGYDLDEAIDDLRKTVTEVER